MKRIIVMMLVFLIAVSSVAMAGGNGSAGPAPNAGDGIPDGSGLDSPNGPVGDGQEDGGRRGPAPNAGDGIPDGPGW